MSEIDKLIADFKRIGWKSHPMERALRIAQSSPSDATQLAYRCVDEIPKSNTFHHAILSFVPLDSWPGLVAHALTALTSNRNNESAESILQYASLQCVEAVHPHLQGLFSLEPDVIGRYEVWSWRAAGPKSAAYLFRVLLDDTKSPQQRLKAWRCLLETRNETTIQQALDHQDCVDLNIQMREYGLPETLTAKEYLSEVGFEILGTGLRKLYSDRVCHLVFPEDYFTSPRRPWLARENHPTWLTPSTCEVHRGQIGGDGRARCGRCGNRTHRLLRFPITSYLPSVSGLDNVSFETCLSCLGWEQPQMFYQHSLDGSVVCLSNIGKKPEFPATALRPAEVSLIDQGARWYWQDWGSANNRENLNRLGGHPTWIQSAEYPTCPACFATMSFVFQLDSDLPTVEDNEWMWGSGGILYVFWCNGCKISGMLWQCT